MELVDRYIHAVTARLPEAQREDIKRELQSLIEDMLEERSPESPPTVEDAESVLQELGHPSELAAKYRGYERYLIGPGLIDAYWTTLKIVTAAIVFSLAAALAIDSFRTDAGTLDSIMSFLASLVSSVAQGFLWVTLIFVCVERSQRAKTAGSGRMKKAWKPSELPPIPEAGQKVKKSGPIFGIFFAVAAIMLALFSPDLIGVWRIHDGSTASVPFFESDVIRHYAPLLCGLAALAILKESVRLIAQRRSGRLLAFHIAMTVLITTLACLMLADDALWNPTFIADLAAASPLPSDGEGFDTLVSVWPRLNGLLVNVLLVYALVDIVLEFMAWFRSKTPSSAKASQKPLPRP
ncbi:putative membrane protein [Paenibacillus pasadenensis]|uniref:Putative membrane protein n=1 Tax=Paenibacillus pasadenensis TaxID=217090 RepID=A0A2N5N8R7_9BACL|nr:MULTISPECIES: hypothetical protein [Paenibacillus]PLT46690.1 putative membrane protein [Paenibacillus pasadenensis]QGG57080.1 hypothetical protein GE073_16810 [Paenibacillus sp. B01]